MCATAVITCSLLSPPLPLYISIYLYPSPLRHAATQRITADLRGAPCMVTSVGVCPIFQTSCSCVSSFRQAATTVSPMNKHQAICTEGKGGGERKECGQQQDNEQAYRREEEPGSSLDEYLDNPPDIKLWPETRQNCVRCGKRSRLYCSDCLLFVGTPTGVKTPTDHLRLPLQVSFVKVFRF